MASIAGSDTTPDQTILPPGVPPLSPDATSEEKDRHWFNHVYQGDKMPQLTVRAVVMGGILGMLMAASNLYTTLAIGWGFGVAITACVISFVFWNLFRLMSSTIYGKIVTVIVVLALAVVGALFLYGGLNPIETGSKDWLRIIGGGLMLLVGGGLSILIIRTPSQMSILENACMASTASAAGYATGSTIATMFGALLLLQEPGPGQTSADIKTMSISPVWAVTLFTLCTGLMGVFLAIPLKRQMINHEQLRFPSGVAAAETLRSLYSKGAEALQKAYTLIVGILVGGLVGIINTPEGILEPLDRVFRAIGLSRLPELVPEDGIARVYGKDLPAYGFEPSVLLIAAGVITRMRVCLSMFIGASLLHFFVIPWLVGLDVATAGSGWITQADGAVVFDPAQQAKEVIKNVEVRGAVLRVQPWSLWGGTAVMVFASLTAVAMQWKTFVRAFSSLSIGAPPSSDAAELKAIEVPFWWMIVGMLPVSIAMLVVQIVAFNISWWAGCIAIAMSFILSLVASRATGETDTTPIGAMGKVMQILFSIFHKGQIVPNLAAAGIAANSAIASADLLTDLKTGYLLGANPRRQFLAQFFGTFFGTCAIVPIWFLMVPTKAHIEKFAAPATRTWEAVARVLTNGIDFLPVSARYAILIGALVGIVLPLIERAVPARNRKYLPSAMGLGLSWVIYYSNAVGFMAGALIIWIWEMVNRRNSDKYAIPLASGLIAGESLIKAIIAMTATAIGIFGDGSGQ